MVQNRRFWVVGGDRRQRALAALLEQDGHRVACRGLDSTPFSIEGVNQSDCILLPLPVVSSPGLLNAPFSSPDIPLSSVLQALSPGQRIFGGRVDSASQQMAAELGLELRDYALREEFAVANAVPTAEGAVRLAMEELPITIHGARVLVLGFGRVGKATARRFHALGAAVTVAARRYESLAWAEAEGFSPVLLGEEDLSAFDLVVNTIPAPVLDRTRLAELRPGTPVLDLASQPGGVDRSAAEDLHIRAIHALGLPGKTAPVTAAAAIRDGVYHMLEELRA